MNYENDYFYDIDILKNVKIIIFGAGVRGLTALKKIKNINIAVEYFCDSDIKKCGQIIDGIEVITLATLKDLDKKEDVLIIIATYNKKYIIEMKEDIDFLNLKTDKILTMFWLDEMVLWHSMRDMEYKYKKKSYPDFSNSPWKLKQDKVSIIIPIYNAPKELKECLDSLLENTDFPYEIMCINDKSTDKKVEKVLLSYKKYNKIKIINNEENLGFVKSINNGFKLTQSDVVLLNSDTKVTRGWLSKMVAAAYHSDDVATVTPFSNNARGFNVPISGKGGGIPLGFTLNEMSDIIERLSDISYPEVPSGNGFCLYIKRDVINKIGFLDEIFGRGYGEENDFCLRARAAGYKNIVCDNTYIYHKGSISFGEERDILIKKNNSVIKERYPLIHEETKMALESYDMVLARKKIFCEMRRLLNI